MLEKIIFVDRAMLGAKFLEFVGSSVPGDAILVPLTSAYVKSAAHMSYYFPDGHLENPVLPLDQALRTNAPLVIFDDVLISGTQAADTVRSWFGEETVLDEELGQPLPEAGRRSLRERQVLFRFVYGHDPGIAHFRSVAKLLSLGTDVAALTKGPAQRPLDEIEHDGGTELREYLRKVGRELLRSTKGRDDPKRWPPKKCAERALGYGNHEQLVVLPYNTPTGTITALWKSGRFGRVPWLPLVPRRGELGEAE